MNQLATTSTYAAPELVQAAGERACFRFLKFFAAQIRNPHTRRTRQHPGTGCRHRQPCLDAHDPVLRSPGRRGEPGRASILDIDAIGQTADLTTIARKPAFVVFNSCNTSTEFDLEEARAGLRERDIPVYPGAVYQRVSYSRGFIPGRTAQEIEPGGRAAAEIGELFRWTADTMGIALPQPASTEAA